MKYNGFNLKKMENGKIKIFTVFGEDATKHEYKNMKEAKGVVDNVLIAQHREKRYMPSHYSHYLWAIIDKTTHLYVKLENVSENGKDKIMFFKNRFDAEAWCEQNNK